VLIQAILVSLIVWLGFLDKAFFHSFIYRPICIGPLVGLVMGNLQIGLQVGVAVELMFLAVVFVGLAIPPDEVLSSAIAAAFACIAGSAEIGIATALPIAVIGQMFRQTRNTTIYELTQRRVERAAANANPSGIILWTTVIPSFVEYILFGLPAFIAVYFGANAVQAIIEFIPEKVITGIAVGGGLIGAVGVALLLSTIKDKTAWPYFLIGFFFASYLGVNMIGIAVIAAVCVALTYYADKKKTQSAQQGA
jgi:mannose/fructose/N-acetylgalactosamine-specific phosphotransferase system component IIC